MQVCRHKGFLIAILTRDEHCPPHVHVGTASWDARFKFGFWHNGIQLWDVSPAQNKPKAALLEELRQVLKQPLHLRRARELWWNSRGTICLENQRWDMASEEVVSPEEHRMGAVDIYAARFEAAGYRTVMQLAGQSVPLEIQL